MTVRITPLRVLFLVAPLLLLAFGLVTYDGYWMPSGPKQTIAAHALIGTSVVCLSGVVLSYVPFVHDFLSQGFWHKLHYVRSSPAQASIAVFVVRYGSQLLLWAVAVLAAIGRG